MKQAQTDINRAQTSPTSAGEFQDGEMNPPSPATPKRGRPAMDREARKRLREIQAVLWVFLVIFLGGVILFARTAEDVIMGLLWAGFTGLTLLGLHKRQRWGYYFVYYALIPLYLLLLVSLPLVIRIANTMNMTTFRQGFGFRD